MVKYTKGKNKTFTELAELHYSNINSSLKNKINSKISTNPPPNQLNFYHWLSHNDYKELKRIIVSEPEELEKIINQINNSGYSNFFQTNSNKLSSTNFGKDMLKIFNYNNFRKSKSFKEWVFNEYDCPVCCYCNRQYTTSFAQYNSSCKTYLLFHFDHFYSKVRYPYLALSFYNLIPSCSSCNSVFKSDTDFKISDYIHPFVDNFNNIAKFNILSHNSDSMLSKSYDFKIIIKPVLENFLFQSDISNYIKAVKTFEFFKLQEILEKHKDYILEIIQKEIFYSKEHINSLYDQYGGILFSSKHDLLRLIFGNYVKNEDLGKRPLAKLTKDIAEQHGMLNF